MGYRDTWGRRATLGLVSAVTAGMMLVASGPAAQAIAPPTEVWHTILTGETENAAAFGADGTLYVAGTDYTSAPDAAVLHAFDPTGAPLWSRRYVLKNARRSNGYDVVVAPDGSIYLLVYSYLGTQKYFVMSLLKFSAAGKKLWVRTEIRVNAYAVAANKKSIVVVGNVGTKATGTDAWVRSYTPAGVVSWTHTYDGGAKKADVAEDVAFAKDGTIYVVGYATPHAATPKDRDAAVWQLTAAGKRTGSRYTKGTVAGGFDSWYGIARTGTQFFVGGEVNDTSSGSSPRDAFVNGTKVVTPRILSWGTGYSTIYGVAALGTKLFEVGVATDGTADSARLVEMDAQRNEVWTATFDTGANDDGYAVAANASQVAMVGVTGNDGFIYVYPS